jgi:hypothetical protein
MTKAEQIRERMKQMHNKGHYDTSAIIAGVVSAVNGIVSIDVDVDGVIYNDVQLQAIGDGSGVSLIIVPQKGSAVLIGNVEHGTNYVLISADKADKIIAKQADDMYIEVAKNGIKLNGDSNDGLVKIKDLVSKVNGIEQKINDLITACTTQVVTLAPSGAFPLASFFTSVTPLAPTQQSELENTKVKHG